MQSVRIGDILNESIEKPEEWITQHSGIVIVMKK